MLSIMPSHSPIKIGALPISAIRCQHQHQHQHQQQQQQQQSSPHTEHQAEAQYLTSSTRSSPVMGPTKPAPSTSEPMLKLRLRNSFIEFAEVPQTSSRLRRSSFPRSKRECEMLDEQPRYLEELEELANFLGSPGQESLSGKEARLRSPTSTESITSLMQFGTSGSSVQEPMSARAAEEGVEQLADVQEPMSTRTAEEGVEQVADGGNAMSQQDGEEGKISAMQATTLMLGNLPYRVTKADIMEAVQHMGYENTCHVCHIPNANKWRPRATNLGYAFICFTNAECAAAFVDDFSNFRFLGTSSTKRCTIAPARVQCRMSTK